MDATSGVTRRGALAAGAAAVLPRRAQGASGRLNIAAVGIGGMGASYLRGCESENIAALCDVDDAVGAKTFARYPEAKRYRDFRVMLEKEKEIDAVIVGTPDHTHAAVALAAMQLGKHVYCAKPLARTVEEVRAMVRTAREKNVATQMSVQSCASEEACATAEWVRAGAVGAVREVHVWSDRPIWPQGVARPAGTPVPEGLDWDLWLGPAPERPYNPLYHPFNWRGWYDFGCGALGDMACHSFHVIFRALELGYPSRAQAVSSVVAEPVEDRTGPRVRIKSRAARLPETFPMASIVTWDFPARGSLPAVRMHWYDGGLKPACPEEMAGPLPADGILFRGDRGTLFSGFYGGPKMAGSRQFTPPAKTLPRSIGHYREWIEAAKGGPPASCNFEFGGLLAETALVGAIAIRTGRPVEWDAAAMRVTNDPDANRYVAERRRAGWSL